MCHKRVSGDHSCFDAYSILQDELAESKALLKECGETLQRLRRSLAEIVDDARLVEDFLGLTQGEKP